MEGLHWPDVARGPDVAHAYPKQMCLTKSAEILCIRDSDMKCFEKVIIKSLIKVDTKGNVDVVFGNLY